MASLEAGVGSLVMRETLAQWLPPLDTGLIVVSGVFLARGIILIRQKNVAAHHRSMLIASLFAALFLVVYVIRFLFFEPKVFAGEGAIRAFYLVLLGTHIVLAILLGPLVLVVLRFAFRQEFARHRRLARVTAPIWAFVAISGWVIYVMLQYF